MELISTVKMKKAQESVVGFRPFALAVLSILGKVAKSDEVLGNFSRTPDAMRELIVIVASQK